MNSFLYIQKRKAGICRMMVGFIVSLAVNDLNAQSAQHVALADKYFAEGEYFTAAGLYEQYLNPSKKEIPQANFPVNSRRHRQEAYGGSFSRTDILYKQAESYRLSHYFNEAAAKYKECYQADAGKYTDAMYWYAVCQRSLGNYAAAEESINTFMAGSSAANEYHDDAKKELETIRFIRNQLSRPDSVMYSIKKSNTTFAKEKGIFAISHISGNRYLYTSTVADSAAEDMNPYHSRLFAADMSNGILDHEEEILIDGLDLSYNQGAACLSADKNILYFTQWKKVNGKNVSSIYFSRKEGSRWGKPLLLSNINTDGFSSKQPFCSADGKTIYFSSDMPGGAGGFDVWSAPLLSDGTAGKPVNAGSMINTTADEQAPFFHQGSQQLVFATDGRQGMGGFDLFASKWNGSAWQMPENLGHPVNSSRDDIYFTAAEGKDLLAETIVGSDRGSDCCLEAYMVKKAPKKKMIAGMVVDCKTNQPADAAEVVLKNNSGKSLNVTTGADGKFSFDISGTGDQYSFNVSKEGYVEKSENAFIEKINDTDWQTDFYQNKTICISEKEKPKMIIRVENVVTLFFDFDKSTLRNREKQILDSIFTVLSENDTYTIQVSGYTDGLGTEEYNKKLSDRRAKACADYLVKKGLDPEKISFVSFGECCPVEMEIINGRDNPDGRSKNRRALINITKDE